MVKDDTREAKLVLLKTRVSRHGGMARGLISESGTKFLSGSFDEVHIHSNFSYQLFYLILQSLNCLKHILIFFLNQLERS